MSEVKVGRVPGRITEVNVVDGETTVNEALGLAELTVESGFSVRLNGEPAEGDAVVSDGDSVTVVKEVKGNSDSVKVGRVPGRITEINIVDGETTVEEALEIADMGVESGFSVRLNGEPAEDSDVLEDGDSLTIVKEVKGN
jgi:uncharacterized Zn ribbon protein